MRRDKETKINVKREYFIFASLPEVQYHNTYLGEFFLGLRPIFEPFGRFSPTPVATTCP